MPPVLAEAPRVDEGARRRVGPLPKHMGLHLPRRRRRLLARCFLLLVLFLRALGALLYPPSALPILAALASRVAQERADELPRQEDGLVSPLAQSQAPQKQGGAPHKNKHER